MTYDVAIIGGGPAGSACAHAIGARCSVVVLDAGMPKLCGGLLNKESMAALKALFPGFDVEEALASAGVLREPRRPALRLYDWDTGFSALTRPEYLNMDRLAFDHWLLSRAEALVNVDIFRGAMAKRIHRDGEGWNIETASPEVDNVRARFVVLATGFHGTARLVPDYQPVRTEQYLALQTEVLHGECREMIAVLSAEHTDYYGWAIPKNGTIHVGVAVPIGNQAVGHEFVASIVRRYCGVETCSAMRGCPIAVPRAIGEMQIDILPGTFSIGEAAGFVSPSSGDGISYAIETGHIVGEMIGAWLSAGRRHDYDAMLDIISRRLRPLRRRMLAQILKSNIMARPWLRRVPERLLETPPGRLVARRLGVAGF